MQPGSAAAEYRKQEKEAVRLIGIVGAAISIFLVVVIPATYYFFAVEDLRQTLVMEAAFTARTVERVIWARPDIWEFETMRLHEIASQPAVDGHEQERIIRDAAGNILAQTDYRSPFPYIAHTAPFFASWGKAGSVDARRSILHLLPGIALSGILGIAIGLTMYITYRLYPLRTLKKTLHSLASEKRKIETTLSSLGEGVITVDREERIVLMNHAAEKLTGWNREDAFGRPARDVYVVRGEPDRAGGDAPSRCALVPREGAERTVEEIRSPIRDEEIGDTGAVIVFRDVTEKTKLEMEVLRGRQLESIGVLAAGIAHDFNNFLTGILGNISLARYHAAGNAKVLERLAESEKASFGARDLVQKLLVFSKGGKPSRKTVDLVRIVTDASDLATRGTGVRFVLKTPQPVWRATADPNQMTQVASNIVINSVQSIAGSGNIAIALKNAEIGNNQVPGLPAGRYVAVRIEDDGPGIHGEAIDRIFEPYFTTREKGSGLGLATCYNIVKAHDGNIFVESSPGKGTAFTFYIPAAPDREEEDAEPARTEEAPEKLHGRILVMDDEEFIRQFLMNTLSQFGCSVTLCADGEEAIRRYGEEADAGRRFDAVIMDLTIPGGMGGKEAAKRILSRYPDACLIVSSGYSNDPVLSNPEKFGFRAVVAKPYRIEDLLRVIGKITA